MNSQKYEDENIRRQERGRQRKIQLENKKQVDELSNIEENEPSNESDEAIKFNQIATNKVRIVFDAGVGGNSHKASTFKSRRRSSYHQNKV